MIKQLMQLLFSTGVASHTIPDDADFFNEPSTLRPHLTADAAAKDSAATATATATTTMDDLSLPSPATAYQIIARGFPGAHVHYAASSA